MKEIIKVKTKEQFDYLYNCSAMTWEGLSEDSFEEALNECGTEDSKGYLIKGKEMNRHYRLTDDNAYPDNLNIFAIDPSKGLAMFVGARWFDDIVNNNKMRQRAMKKN